MKLVHPFILAAAVLLALNFAQQPQPVIVQHQPDHRININAASSEELQRLPGLGPALAARIVEHRRKHGAFKRPQEIIIVQGMSAKRYRRIAHLIRI